MRQIKSTELEQQIQSELIKSKECLDFLDYVRQHAYFETYTNDKKSELKIVRNRLEDCSDEKLAGLQIQAKILRNILDEEIRAVALYDRLKVKLQKVQEQNGKAR